MSLTVIDKMMPNVKSLRKVFISIKNIFLVIENCIVDLSSRKRVSKWLLKLPAQFFPSNRLIISTTVIERNKKVRKLRKIALEYSSESSEEEFGNHKLSKSKYVCCKYCHKLFHSDVEEKTSPNTKINNLDINCMEVSSSVDTLAVTESNDPVLTPPLRRITLADLTSVKLRPSQNFKNISRLSAGPQFPNASPDHEGTPNVSGNLFLTPPLRKITIEELTSVKLRPSQAFQKIPKTPDVQDMLNVLRRRYAAMHSPMASENDSFTSDEDSVIFDDHQFEETSSYLYYNECPSYVC